MKWYNLTYFMREAVSSIGKHRVMSVAAIGVIAACLLIMGSFMLVAVNVENMLREVESQNEIIVFVDETLESEKASGLSDKLLAADSNVAQVTYTSKEDALVAFREELGDDQDLLDGLEGDNPLRNRYSIKLHDIGKTAETAEKLSKVDGIAEVSARSDISDKILQVRHIVTVICVILIIVLLAVAVFIISNTVNLTIFNRREEIAIMKMVGAGNGFVRSPFIIEGLLLGMLGAFIAIFLQWGLYSYVVKTALNGLEIFSFIPFASLAWQLLAVFVGVGVLVGGAGSAITMRKFLKV